VPGVHHAAICTSDVDRSMRFWRDGLGLTELFDQTFTGDWPELFGAKTGRLRSIFPGDPQTRDGKTVPMAVITAPDGVLVELIGPPA
jgi:catechol 2,3-dioxygenase-like lactoylglutathione lyase family enzyme